MSRWAGWFVAIGVCVPASAQGQNVYLTSERSEAYVPLAARGADVTPLTFTSRDEGILTLTLPFSFSFFGTDYSEVMLGVNGHLQFGDGPQPSFRNEGLETTTVDNLMAVWWDDLILPDVSGSARTAVLGRAPDRIFVIEVEDWERWSFSNLLDGAFQVWLYESPPGQFEYRYGRLLTESENYTATVGYRAGGQISAFRPCGAVSANCSAEDYGRLSNRVIRVRRIVE
ncbi:MAG: hypothetical protein AAFN74_27005, partial [Myxococcota bacterium]